MSIFKPVAGEMRFIKWCMSFLADKAASSCQTIVSVAEAAGQDIQKQLLDSTAPFSYLEISDLLGKRVQDLVSFLQSPQFPVDIWNVVAQVDQRIDKRLGLTELMYGMTSKQMRSATEAQVRDENISIRPDDMANQVEDFVSASNLKEAECARFHLQTEDGAPVLGPLGSMAWERHITGTDPDVVVREYSFHIEGGSARKPNKQNRVRQLQEFGQVANVVRRPAVSGRGGAAAMLRHCLSHGFEAAGQRGGLYGGTLAEPDDLWLRATPGRILASRPMHMLGSRFAMC